MPSRNLAATRRDFPTIPPTTPPTSRPPASSVTTPMSHHHPSARHVSAIMALNSGDACGAYLIRSLWSTQCREVFILVIIQERQVYSLTTGAVRTQSRCVTAKLGARDLFSSEIVSAPFLRIFISSCLFRGAPPCDSADFRVGGLPRACTSNVDAHLSACTIIITCVYQSSAVRVWQVYRFDFGILNSEATH